jgi:hypothetical protein
VDFVIYKLAKRLGSPHWAIAAKALMVFHRLMRECDASFPEQVGGARSGLSLSPSFVRPGRGYPCLSAARARARFDRL